MSQKDWLISTVGRCNRRTSNVAQINAWSSILREENRPGYNERRDKRPFQNETIPHRAVERGKPNRIVQHCWFQETCLFLNTKLNWSIEATRSQSVYDLFRYSDSRLTGKRYDNKDQALYDWFTRQISWPRMGSKNITSSVILSARYGNTIIHK